MSEFTARSGISHEELGASREDFLATIIHDIKSPISCILGYAEVIADPKFGIVSGNKVEYARTIQHLGDELLSLVENIVSIVYTVEHGASETRALELAARFQPDLILLFHPLPHLPVETVWHFLRTNPATERIPTVLLCPSATAEWRRTFDEVVELPVRMSCLSEIIERVLADRAIDAGGSGAHGHTAGLRESADVG